MYASIDNAVAMVCFFSAVVDVHVVHDLAERDVSIIDNACGDTGHPLAVKQKMVDFRAPSSILVVDLRRFVLIWVDLSGFKLIWVDFGWSILLDFVGFWLILSDFLSLS